MEKVAGVGLVFFMAVMAVTIPITVFSRYILQNTPTWTDETALFSLVWASMLGAAIGLRRGYQVGIRSLIEKSPRALSAIMEGSGFAFMIFFFAIMVIFGSKQTITNWRQLSAAMRLPMALPYLALPVGFLMMLLFTLEDSMKFLAKLGTRKGK